MLQQSFYGLKFTQFWTQSVLVMTDAMEMENNFFNPSGCIYIHPNNCLILAVNRLLTWSHKQCM